jgi:galactokinase
MNGTDVGSADRISTPSSEPVASAPGRIEFIGNHVDYNGGWVLGVTIDRRVQVSLSRRSDARIITRSQADVPEIATTLGALRPRDGEEAWANYPLGAAHVLRSKGLDLDTGFELTVSSQVPTGAGLSSSAALVMATAIALVDAYGGAFDQGSLVQVSRAVENDFVGVPCGVLDPAVIAFGGTDHLVRVDAGTESVVPVPFPKRTEFWIFETHEDHTLAASQYEQRVRESAEATKRARRRLVGVRTLTDIRPEQLDRLKGSLPDRLYRRARHVVTEHARVRQAVALLERGDLEAVGELLFESHESSRTDYENSTAALDFVVDRLRERDAVLGARLTGAGFGGAVLGWTRPSFDGDDARALASRYERAFGAELSVRCCRPAPGARAEDAPAL